MIRFHIVTIFPEVCKAYTDASILGRAQRAEKGKGAKHEGIKIKIDYYNPRDFSSNKHHKIDHRPYGGGPGMVMMAEPIISAVKKALNGKNRRKSKIVILSPRGKLFTHSLSKKWARSYDDIVFISGRYEGIDARVKKILRAEEVSVGDYILTGGELPALTILDAVARNVEGVLGTFESLEDERISSGEMYTRPPFIVYNGKSYRVPKVLISGNHAHIETWKKKNDQSTV